MADRKLPPDRESWDASEERLRSHIPNLEAFLQDIYTRSTGLSVEPTSAQFNTLSARVDANSGKASATVTSDHFSVLSQAISVLSQQVSALSQGVSVLSQQVSVLSQNLSALSSIGPNLRLSAGAGLGLSIHTEAGFDTIDVIGAGQDLYLRGNNVFLGNLANTANFSFQSALTGYRVRFPAADWFWVANDFQIAHTSAQLRLGPDADQVVLKKAGTSVLQISAQSVEITGNLNVSGTLSSPVLNTLSNQISVLSQAVSVLSQQVSVLSQQVSVLSQGISVVSVGVDRVSNAVSNETSNRISADNVLSNQISVLSQQVSILSQQISILSQQVSVHSQQISVLSQQVSVLSQQVSVLSQGLSVVSVGVDRVSNAVSNETSNRISADNVLSVKIDTVSNQVSVLSQQVSVLSQQISILSQQVSVLSQQVSVISQKLSSVGAWFVRGLSGLVSGSSTVNLAADAVGFWNPTDKSINTVISVTTVTNDVGLSADQINGRDQAAVFTSSIWVHFYFVLDGTTVKTRSSLTTPANGPTLQGTEKAWAYAGAVRRNASNNLLLTRFRGAYEYYDIATPNTRVLTDGVATIFTAVSLAGFVPPNATRVELNTILDLSNAAVTTFSLYLRPTGSVAGGVIAVIASEEVANTATDTRTAYMMPLGTTSQIDYKMDAAPTSGGASLDVHGFTVPNGDA